MRPTEANSACNAGSIGPALVLTGQTLSAVTVGRKADFAYFFFVPLLGLWRGA